MDIGVRGVIAQSAIGIIEQIMIQELPGDSAGYGLGDVTAMTQV